jgi:hypothetical protein
VLLVSVDDGHGGPTHYNSRGTACQGHWKKKEPSASGLVGGRQADGRQGQQFTPTRGGSRSQRKAACTDRSPEEHADGAGSALPQLSRSSLNCAALSRQHPGIELDRPSLERLCDQPLSAFPRSPRRSLKCFESVKGVVPLRLFEWDDPGSARPFLHAGCPLLTFESR